MKTLLKCHCGHAYFEGEGCRGCFYSEFPHKMELQKHVAPDGYEERAKIIKKRCVGCGFHCKREENKYCSVPCANRMRLLKLVKVITA